MVTLEDNYYKEYRALGGKMNKTQYLEWLDVFLTETVDIFVHGDTSKHSSREEAIDEVMNKTTMGEKDLELLFSSVDNVTAYT